MYYKYKLVINRAIPINKPSRIMQAESKGNDLQKLLVITDDEINKATSKESHFNEFAEIDKRNKEEKIFNRLIVQEEAELKKNKITKVKTTLYHCKICQYNNNILKDIFRKTRKVLFRTKTSIDSSRRL